MSVDVGTLLAAFRSRFGRPPSVVSQAPARVNLIGEHTDYNLGHVLPVAIDRTVAAAAAPREDGRVSACALDLGEDDSFELEGVQRLDGGGWRNYVRGIAWALGQAGQRLVGLDVAIAGDVPVGAGLSSSAALEVALAGAFLHAAGADFPPQEIAVLAQRAENDFVGVQCGLMDQVAAVFGRLDHALLIDCRTLAVEPVPLGLDEAGVSIAVVDSGVRRSLADTPYNRRREECFQAARLLGVKALRDADEAILESRRSALPGELYRRARHVVREEERVAAAVGALRGGDPAALGDLLNQSHASLRDDFQVSCPELDLLVELAARTKGVLGSRLTGAGFGGCTVSLVRRRALDAFRRQVVEEYRSRTGLPARMYVCRAVDGLRVNRV